MKKLKLFAMGLVGSTVLLTSCADDKADDPVLGPNLTVKVDGIDVASGETIDVAVGNTFNISWIADARDADLEDFSIEIDGVPAAVTTTGGETLPYEDISASQNDTYADDVTFPATTVSSKDYTLIIEDENGQTKSVTVTINVTTGTTNLSAAQNFQWMRMGGNPGTGLDQFGLVWTNNGGSPVKAEIEDGSATKMVMLTSASWSDITTVEGLQAAIDAAASITEYTGVSASASGTYDDVLGVIHMGNLYMIHVTNATVTSGGGGTDITITGEYKSS